MMGLSRVEVQIRHGRVVEVNPHRPGLEALRPGDPPGQSRRTGRPQRHGAGKDRRSLGHGRDRSALLVGGEEQRLAPQSGHGTAWKSRVRAGRLAGVDQIPREKAQPGRPERQGACGGINFGAPRSPSMSSCPARSSGLMAWMRSTSSRASGASRSRALRTNPSAAARTVRASAAGRSPSEHDDGRLDLEIRRGEGRLGPFRFATRGGLDDAHRAVLQFPVGRPHVHHQVLVDLAQSAPWRRC